MASRQKELLKEKVVFSAGIRKSDYSSERIFAKAEDGVEIPISLVYKKGFKKDGTAPLLLTGMAPTGSAPTQISIPIRSACLIEDLFSPSRRFAAAENWPKLVRRRKALKEEEYIFRLHLLRSVFGGPTVRSAEKGGDFGRQRRWALNGCGDEHASGPVRQVIAVVPFVDLINTMSDPSLPLTVTEYEEWGNPEDPKYYDYMASYSPYDNVQDKHYPNLLVTAGLNDSAR